LMCHEFARKEKNGRGRNERESIKRDTYILWKTLRCPAGGAAAAPKSTESRRRRGFSFQSTVKPRTGMAELQRAATTRARLSKADFVNWSGGIIPRNERPVRGDNRTGQAIWARLGWMGARAEYSLDGEG
jgi:hypothetical protein